MTSSAPAPPAGPQYVGVIPAVSIDPDWDLMYAISVTDESGAKAFYPDLDKTAPYVVVEVVSSSLSRSLS